MEDKTLIEIKKTIEDAIQAELGAYKVPKETHYQDHLWINEIRDWTGTIKSSAIRSVVTAVVGGTLFLLILGFVLWGKQNIH